MHRRYTRERERQRNWYIYKSLVRNVPFNKYIILNIKIEYTLFLYSLKSIHYVRGSGRDDNDDGIIFADSVHITNKAQAVMSSTHVTTSPLLHLSNDNCLDEGFSEAN